MLVIHVNRQVRKRTVGHVRLAKIEISLRIRIFIGCILESQKMQTFFMWTAKTLIRLCVCAGWFEFLLDARVSWYIFLRCGSFINVVGEEYYCSKLHRNKPSLKRETDLPQFLFFFFFFFFFLCAVYNLCYYRAGFPKSFRFWDSEEGRRLWQARCHIPCNNEDRFKRGAKLVIIIITRPPTIIQQL